MEVCNPSHSEGRGKESKSRGGLPVLKSECKASLESSEILSQNKLKESWKGSSVVECLQNMSKILCSVSNTGVENLTDWEDSSAKKWKLTSFSF